MANHSKVKYEIVHVYFIFILYFSVALKPELDFSNVQIQIFNCRGERNAGLDTLSVIWNCMHFGLEIWQACS